MWGRPHFTRGRKWDAGTVETSITLPNTITFRPGEPYQLWLQARTSRRTSAPGPVQNWTAP